MTVQELINELSKYPKDKKVYTSWGLANYIGENFYGNIILTHRETEEEKEQFEQMKREWEEERERAMREPAPRGVW